MAVYEITAPDGEIYEVTAPDNASEDEVLQYAIDNYQGATNAGQTPENVRANKSLPVTERMYQAMNQPRDGLPAAGDTWDEIVRQGGRTVRNLATGMSSALDIPRLATDPLLKTAGYVAERAGFPKTGQAIAAEANAPMIHQMVQSGIDDLTGGELLPRTGTEEAVDAASQFMAAAVGPKVAQEASKATIKGASRVADSLRADTASLKSGLKTMTPEKIQGISDSLSANASSTYKAMRDSNAIMNQKPLLKLIGKARAEIGSSKGARRVHKETLDLLNDMADDVAKGNFHLDNLDEYRQLFSTVIEKNLKPTGGVNKVGNKASGVIGTIDEYVNTMGRSGLTKGDKNAVHLLNKARSEWAQKSKFDDISRIVVKAKGDPEKIKRGLDTLLSNPKRTRGYSASELDAIRKAADSSTLESALKFLGKFGFDQKNVLVPGLSTAAGLGPLVAGGTAARQGAKYIGRGRAEELLKTLSNQ